MQLTPTNVEVTDESNQRIFKATYEQDGVTCYVTCSGPLDMTEEVFLANANQHAVDHFERMKTVPKPMKLEP